MSSSRWHTTMIGRSWLLLGLVAVCILSTKMGIASEFDVLVFAPHPDDEVLGCAGVMLRALEENKRVGVVVVTNGGGFPKATSIITGKPQDQLSQLDYHRLAAERQRQSLAGLTILGVSGANLMFLGYPDSGLAAMYRSENGIPYRQKFTGKDQTYGIVVPDYHSRKHGRPAPYTRAALLADMVGIIKTSRPKEIYVTHEVDRHSDHKAAFWFVRDAARAARFRGKLLTYVVHGQQRPKLPLYRVSLTAAQVDKKRAAIRPHQIPIVHDHLDEHAKKEELFWLAPIDSSSKNMDEEPRR